MTLEPNQPPGENSVFLELQANLDCSDAATFRKFFDQYSLKLVRLAGKNIHPALLKRFDGEDVVQSVFRTFFRRHRDGEFQIEHSQQLWQLLVTLTLCKTRSHARKHTALRRNVQADHVIANDQQLIDRQPAVDDALAMWEEIDVMLDGLPLRAGEIVSMRLEGKNKSEIASELNLSRQSIHRILKLVQERLERRFAQFSSEEPTNFEKSKDSM